MGNPFSKEMSTSTNNLKRKIRKIEFGDVSSKKQKQSTLKWWQEGPIYHIYPKSFHDTSGNGIGDLKGITEKLSYLKTLDVKGIWISPFFKSPMVDNGYDVSDYKQVDPVFGDINDFKELIKEAKKCDIKIIIDFVP